MSRQGSPSSRGSSCGSSRGSSVSAARGAGSKKGSPLSPSRKLEPRSNNVLNAQNLQRLDLHNLLQGHLEEEPDLDYPCKDKSKNVNDFSEWSFFKRPQFHEPPLNMKHSFLWNPKILEKISQQKDYLQYTPEAKLTGYKETRANLDRKKRAKRMLAVWKKKPMPSYAEATDGTLTGRTDSATVGLSSMSIAGPSGRAGQSQNQSRGRSIKAVPLLSSSSSSRDRTKSPPQKGRGGSSASQRK